MGEMWFFASKYWRWQIIEIHQIRLFFFPQWYSCVSALTFLKHKTPHLYSFQSHFQ